MAGFQFATMQDVKRIARAVLKSERALRGGESFGYPGSKNQIWWPFKNEFAGTIPAYSVVEITDAVQVPGLDLTYYKATRPSTTYRMLYGVTSGLAVPEGKAGQLRFSGMGRIAYDTGTPAKYEGWGVKPGQFTLSKGFPALSVVSRIESTAKKWLLGSFDQNRKLFIKATTAITTAAVSTGSQYDILSGTSGSETDAGFTVVPDFYNPGVAFATNDKGWIEFGAGSGWIGGKIC